MKAKQTPLINLLERIPQDARLVVEHDEFSSSSYPVGRLCHEAATALRAALAQPKSETCTWHQDGDSDSGVYATSCRHYLSLEDGTPENNKLHWCCYCGKKLAQELITEDDDE